MTPGLHESVCRQVLAMQQAEGQEKRRECVAAIVQSLFREGVLVPLYSNRVHLYAHPQLHNVCLDAYGWMDYSRLLFGIQ